MNTEREAMKQALNAAVEALGLTHSAKFVPVSQSRNAKEKFKPAKDAGPYDYGSEWHPTLNWVITVARGNQALTLDYSQGIANLPGYSERSSKMVMEHDAILVAVETGKWCRTHDKAGFRNGVPVALPAPSLLDVLYCIIQDSSVLNYAGFEDWASDYGYDVDSRNGEKTYHACLEIGLKLQAMLGAAALASLRELFQDY